MDTIVEKVIVKKDIKDEIKTLPETGVDLDETDDKEDMVMKGQPHGSRMMKHKGKDKHGNMVRHISKEE